MSDQTIVTLDGQGFVSDIDGPETFASRAPVIHVEPARGLARPETPSEMIGLATLMATSLKDIVDRQKLYTVISGRKFPMVEAWMTIGRMDNVVARESERPVRHEDGSYEAFVELIRLSDGMIVGRASALCGTADDTPWNKRGEPQRRSMAATRATSRAFRQQYSWIMALAGYEPTPADEMPTQPDPEPPKPVSAGEHEELLGTITKPGTIRTGGGAGYKLEARQHPEGMALGFRLEVDADKAIPQVIIEGQLGADVIDATGGKPEELAGKWAKVRGRLYSVSQAGRTTYTRLRVTSIETRDWTLPAETEANATSPAPTGQLFSADDEAELDRAAG